MAELLNPPKALKPPRAPFHTAMSVILLGPVIGAVICYFYAKNYEAHGLPAKRHWQTWAITSGVVVLVAIMIFGAGTGASPSSTGLVGALAPTRQNADWLEKSLVDEADWDDDVAKSAECAAEQVDANGVGTYRCTLWFLADPDSYSYVVETRADGMWSAQTIK